MFTGLVEEIGRVARIERRGPDASLALECSFEGLVLGESVAVDGACLTVGELGPAGFVASTSAETLSRTTLGELGPGRRVHLERALPLGGRLGGHLVTGHVDAVARVLEVRERGRALEVVFELPATIERLVAEKGSIAVDGVSLTVNSVAPGAFHVMLVPFTRGETHLDRKRPGDRVNLEADVIAKHVARLLDPSASTEGRRAGVTLELLARHGFVR